MLDYIKSYWTLRWTQQPMYHPIPSNITRTFIKTAAGDIELLIAEPVHGKPGAVPIFFVHGGNGHASVWLEWMTHLAETYGARTYAYSLRNHGASFAVPYLRMVWLTSFDDLASDLKIAIKESVEREGQEPIVVAHSSGGGLAQYIISKGHVTVRGLALVGAVPHFGNVLVYSNWFTKIDRWFMLRNFAHFCHPNSGLNTDRLVYNAFFGPEYPIARVTEFRRWMANYECMWWPYSMGGSGWTIQSMTWLRPLDILRNIASWNGDEDKVMVMIGTNDLMMGGTERRMVTEFQDAIKVLQREKRIDRSADQEKNVVEKVDKYVTEERQGGVRLVEVLKAGHHTQNDMQWREACEALRRFAEQVRFSVPFAAILAPFYNSAYSSPGDYCQKHQQRPAAVDMGKKKPTVASAPPVIREPAVEEDNAEPLPAYDLEETQQRILADTTEATGDGRIEVNLDSKIASVFARLVDIPDVPEYVEAPPVYEEAPPWTLCLNIVIQVVGSRGDVQPFVAMGNALQKYGHRVRIATHNVFKDFVQSAGLEFYPIGGDPVQLMAYMVKNPGLIPNMKSLRGGEIGAKRRMISEMLLGCWKSCVEPDPDTDAPFVANAIIANPVSFAHIHCAQALSIPLHMVFTMPWSPTRAFPHPLANVRNTTTDPKLANYLSFGLVNALTWQGLGDIINAFRKDVLGLEMVPATEGPFLSETLRISHTYCWSPALVPKPKDWSDHIDVTGFIFRELPNYTPDEDLAAFLRAGPPPVYIGFGSIVVERPDVLLRTILTAVELSKVRCIISKGWSSLAAEELPDYVFLIDECPHEWLFQQTFAVVHHGGAGTTAAGLRAGKPTVIVPFFGDQPFWGDMVAAAGAGPAPIPHQKLDAGKLAKAIEFCKTAEVSDAAKAVAAKMEHERGAQAAVESFHRHLQPENLRCDLIPAYPALFHYTKIKRGDFLKVKLDSKVLKLSGLAAEILTRSDKVRPKDLKVYHAQPIIIENRRWDPVTSSTSAGIGVAVDMITTTNDLWYAPYKLHSRRHKPTSSASSFVSTKSTSKDDESELPGSSSSNAGRRTITPAKYAGASASTIPKLFGVFVKGTLVDLPDALTEGLRATPKLYGENVRDHAPITNWSSGFKVAGKDLVVGVGTGVADIFVQPYKGAREDGAKGFAAGIGKGFLGTFTKVGYGTVGLYSHSAKGLWKSYHAARTATTRKDILSAKRIHDIYFARNEASKVDEAAVVAAFEEV